MKLLLKLASRKAEGARLVAYSPSTGIPLNMSSDAPEGPCCCWAKALPVFCCESELRVSKKYLTRGLRTQRVGSEGHGVVGEHFGFLFSAWLMQHVSTQPKEADKPIFVMQESS